MSLILALDLGTSAVKIMLMDSEAKIHHVSSHPYPSQIPRQGWIEQEPGIWFKTASTAVKSVLSEEDRKSIDIISLSGHMSGLVAVDRQGNPLFPCITLADTRCTAQCDEIASLAGSRIAEITGNAVINAFLLPKLLWFKQNHKGLYHQTRYILSPKDYLRFCLTGKFATDSTDAGNSLLFNISDRAYDKELIKELGFCPDIFPDLLEAYDITGPLTEAAARETGLRPGTPVACGAADMACQALGAGLSQEGVVSATVGTSATMLMSLKKPDQMGLNKVTFHPHVIPGLIYTLGSHFSGGLSLNWFSGVLKADQSKKVDYAFLDRLTEEAALAPIGSNGILFMPYLVGSGSPHFNPNLHGAFLGLSLVSDRGSMYRAIMEGITYNMKETLLLFESMQSGIKTIKIAGGGMKAFLWPQVLADIFEKDILHSENSDESTIGAAILGGYAAGMFKSLDLPQSIQENSTFIKHDPLKSEKYGCFFKEYQRNYNAFEGLNH